MKDKEFFTPSDVDQKEGGDKEDEEDEAFGSTPRLLDTLRVIETVQEESNSRGGDSSLF